MTEQEAQDREVTVGPDAITDGKIAVSLTAHAGRNAYTETLRLTSFEAVEVHRALGAFLSVEAAPSDTDEDECEHDWPMLIVPGAACLLGCGATRAGGAPSDTDQEAKCEHGIALSDLCHYVETVVNASQPVQVEVTADMVERAAKAIAIANNTPWDIDPQNPDDVYVRDARAALTAALGGGE